MEVFNLNIRPGKTCPVIHCSQFDKGRTFRANLYDGSEVFTLTAAETLSVIEKKSDGNMVTIGVTNTSDSYVEFATTEQMTALAGPQICELRIVEGDTLIGSANFILDCKESPDTGIESESEIHNLETQIQDINEQIVPDMVAEEVANQYDSQNVIFDDAPTENHGRGYAVTSEGVKNALNGKPDNLSDLGDVDISSPTSKQALVYNPTTHKWENAMIPQTGTIEDVAIASFSDGADDVPVSGLIFDINPVQDLHGYDKPWVGGAGKNKFDISTITTGQGINTNSGDTFANANWNVSDFIPIKEGKVTISWDSTSGFYQVALAAYDSTTAFISGSGVSFSAGDTYSHTFDVPSGANYIRVSYTVAVGGTAVERNNIRLNAGSSDLGYEPYENICPITGHDSGVITVTDNDQITNTYTVDFGRTVYGGFFDNRGNLVVTHGIVDLGTLTWTKVTSFTNILFLATVTGKATNNSDIICSDYNNVGIATGGTFLNNMANNSIASDTATGIYIRDDAKSSLSAADFKTAMSGVMLVYDMDDLPSFPVAGQDVRTLLGNNNIFVNTGNIRRLEYFKTGCENIAKLIEAAPNLASVQSVNGRTGAVELDAFNTPYDSENSIAEKIDENTQAIDEKADKATSLSGYGITDAYTKTEINNTLANYLTNAIYKSTAWGSFAGLVTNNSTWLFVAQRLSTNNTYVCVLNRYNNNYSIKDIVKDSSMSIVTNDQGTVTFNYGGSPTGVHVMALKIAQS